MGYILDIGILLILVLCIYRGAKRGAVRAAFSMLSFIFALILTFMFYSPFAQFVEQTEFGKSMHTSVEASLAKKLDSALFERDTDGDAQASNTTESILDSLAVPKFMKKTLFLQSDFAVRNADTSATVAVAGALTSAYMKIITAILLFLAMLILMRILRFIAEQIFKLPLLKDVNKFVGGAAGLVNGIFVSFLLLSTVSALTCLPGFDWLVPAKEASFIFKNVYENNIILSALL